MFWKLLDKLSPKVNSKINSITSEVWVDYFKCKNDVEERYPNDFTTNGHLDYSITMDELIKALTILKPGKAPGIDSVNNEILMCMFQIYPEIFLKLFNTIYTKRKRIPMWSTAIITLIHKKGPLDNPANFRGISLLPCLGKFYREAKRSGAERSERSEWS